MPTAMEYYGNITASKPKIKKYRVSYSCKKSDGSVERKALLFKKYSLQEFEFLKPLGWTLDKVEVCHEG